MPNSAILAIRIEKPALLTYIKHPKTQYVEIIRRFSQHIGFYIFSGTRFANYKNNEIFFSRLGGQSALPNGLYYAHI